MLTQLPDYVARYVRLLSVVPPRKSRVPFESCHEMFGFRLVTLSNRANNTLLSLERP